MERDSLRICALVVAIVLSLALLGSAAGQAAAHHRTPCANRLCTKYKPHTFNCYKLQRLKGTPRVATCFIRRAARNFHQPTGAAVRVAKCESTLRWWIRGHHQGMFQFLWSTWRSTPYRHYSPFNPRYASLAAMWMWAHGRRGEWQCR